jgi:competence protein ComEC
MMLGFILKFLIPGKRLERPRSVVLMILLVVYAGITGFSASVLRSTVMFLFMAGARLAGRSTNIFNTLAASAMALLIYDPYLIMDVGFQLSYLAVLGIVSVQPWLFGLWEVQNRVADWVWNITCVSIAAQLVTFPLGLLYFHQFPNLFLFSNLVVIPVATAILGLFFPLVLLSWWDCALQCIGCVMKWTVWLLNWSVGFINDMPYAVWKGIEVSTGQALFIYAAIAAVLVVLMRRRARLLLPALLSLLGVLMFDAFDLYLARQQRSETVYNINGHQAISVIDGRTVHFYADPEFLSDTSGIDFHVRHHWWSSLANNIQMHPISRSKDSLPIIESTGSRILCFNRHDAEVLQGSHAEDILYIHGFRWAELDRMAELFSGKEVIIGTGMGHRSAQRAIEVFSHDLTIKVTDLRNGAVKFDHRP